MISAILSRVIILAFGTLYPAYCSYKAIRTKNVKEYVRWMMHWVVFSCFVTVETFSDVFLSWFPFYYEIKVLIVFWLLSPMTKGSSILYKKFIHPKLSRHEQEIDEYINQAKEKGYKAVIEAGTKTFDYASKLIVETAIKATTVVSTPPQISARDVTDYAVKENVHRQLTPAPEPILQPSLQDNYIEQANDINFEFSDAEMELDEPIPKRTRSQSRAKENSIPPAEPVLKHAKVKRASKKGDPEYAADKPRRRRRIKEEPEPLEITDDE